MILLTKLLKTVNLNWDDHQQRICAVAFPLKPSHFSVTQWIFQLQEHLVAQKS